MTGCAPEWIDRPALSRVGATTPDIVRRLNRTRKGAPYAEQVKPTNFVLAAHVKPMGHPEGVDPEQFQLIASYSSDPREWLKLKWVVSLFRSRRAMAAMPTLHA